MSDSASTRVGIVGAGLAGLTCARELKARFGVRLIEKARGVGGRIATRRGDGVVFNHGAQYFTASTAALCHAAQQWQADGVVTTWSGRYVHLRGGEAEPVIDDRVRYVALPGMNALPKHLARGLDVRLGVTAVRVQREAGQWQVIDSDGGVQGPFDVLVLTVPAPQAANLLGAADPFARVLGRVHLQPTWSLMVTTREGFDPGFDAARLPESPLALIARTSVAAGEQPSRAWIAHASHAWSQQQLERSPEEVVAALRPLLAEAFGDDGAIEQLAAHRWRYALCDQPVAAECLWDGDRRLGLCGDWCVGPRVESAYLSGLAMASRIAACLG
jgi:predicted NAD/FAD-dependent oxidoreductase